MTDDARTHLRRGLATDPGLSPWQRDEARTTLSEIEGQPMRAPRAPPARPRRHRRLPLRDAPAPASAHPLGNFTVNRYTGILVSPDGVEVDHVVDLAEIPTAQLGTAIDDLPALAATRVRHHRARARRHRSAAAPYASRSRARPRRSPTARADCRSPASPAPTPAPPTSAPARSPSRTRTAPGSVGWREVTAVGDEMTLTSSDVPDESTSDRLTSYPEDLLQSPLDVTSATLVVSPGGPAGVLPGSGDAGPTATDGSWLVGARHRAARRQRLARGGPRASSPRSRWAPPTRSRRATARP